MLWIAACCVYLIMSLVAAIALVRDKRAAKADRRRTPEKTLHTLELLCGWPGSLLAQRLAHHKTRKRSYQVTFWAIVLLHAAIWAATLWLRFSSTN